MNDQLVLCEVDGLIAKVTINRPNQMNALNAEVLKELQHVFGDLKNQDVRLVILTGMGEKSFVAGADIQEMNSMDSRAGFRYSELGNRVLQQISLFPAPVIAAVNGYALGGGFELALACDVILASDNAVFAFPETTLGITPGFGGTQRLARLIGLNRAKDLIFTARRINAAEAQQLGIVSQVIDRNQFKDAVQTYARSIAANAPMAVAAAKRAINRGFECSLESALAFESEAFSSCFSSQDRKNAMDAFLIKQKPGAFENR